MHQGFDSAYHLPEAIFHSLLCCHKHGDQQNIRMTFNFQSWFQAAAVAGYCKLFKNSMKCMRQLFAANSGCDLKQIWLCCNGPAEMSTWTGS